MISLGEGKSTLKIENSGAFPPVDTFLTTFLSVIFLIFRSLPANCDKISHNKKKERKIEKFFFKIEKGKGGKKKSLKAKQRKGKS